MIQHSVTHFVLNQSWNKYHRDSISILLHKLEWSPLQGRRRQAKLIFLFKSVSQINIFQPIFLQSLTQLITLSNYHSCTQEHVCISTHFYPLRIIPDWNNLCIDKINELDVNLLRTLNFLMKFIN